LGVPASVSGCRRFRGQSGIEKVGELDAVHPRPATTTGWRPSSRSTTRRRPTWCRPTTELWTCRLAAGVAGSRGSRADGLGRNRRGGGRAAQGAV